MKKRMMISTISSIVSVIVSFGISFVLSPFLISNIGKELYSFYPITNNTVNYMIIVTSAINAMAARFICVDCAKKDGDPNKCYSTIFFTNIVLSIIIFAISLVLLFFIGNLLEIPIGFTDDVRLLFALIVLSMIIDTNASVFGISLFVNERMDLRYYKEIIQHVLKALLLLIMYNIFKPSLLYLGFAIVFTSAFNYAFLYISHSKLSKNIRINIKFFDFVFLKQILVASFWNIVNALGSSLLAGLSLVLANRFISSSAGGDLSIVQTLPHAVTLLINAIYSVCLPRLTNVFASGENDKLLPETIATQKMLSFIITVPLIMFVVLGREFYSLWVSSEDANYLQNISILSLIPLFIHANIWTIYGLSIVHNKLKIPGLCLLFTGLLNVIVIIVGLKSFSRSLELICIINIVMNVLYYLVFLPLYISKIMRISYLSFYINVFKSAAFTMAFSLVGFLVFSNVNVDSWLKLFVFGGLYCLLLYFIYFFVVYNRIERKDLLKIFIKENKNG